MGFLFRLAGVGLGSPAKDTRIKPRMTPYKPQVYLPGIYFRNYSMRSLFPGILPAILGQFEERNIQGKRDG
jgi:hypothetical protein